MGYGDLHPSTPASRAFTLFFIIYGIVVPFASLASLLATIMDRAGSRFKQAMACLRLLPRCLLEASALDLTQGRSLQRSQRPMRRHRFQATGFCIDGFAGSSPLEVLDYQHDRAAVYVYHLAAALCMCGSLETSFSWPRGVFTLLQDLDFPLAARLFRGPQHVLRRCITAW